MQTMSSNRWLSHQCVVVLFAIGFAWLCYNSKGSIQLTFSKPAFQAFLWPVLCHGFQKPAFHSTLFGQRRQVLSEDMVAVFDQNLPAGVWGTAVGAQAENKFRDLRCSQSRAERNEMAICARYKFGYTRNTESKPMWQAEHRGSKSCVQKAMRRA